MDKCEWCGGDHKIDDCPDEIEITEKGIVALENSIKKEERAKVIAEVMSVLDEKINYLNVREFERIKEEMLTKVTSSTKELHQKDG